MIRYSLAAILALLLLGLAGCGGGDDGERAGPATTTQPASPAPAGPTMTPTIIDNLLEFPARGYSVRFPEGWKAMPDFLPGSDFSVDAFFGPEEIEGVRPNIAVTREQISEGTPLDEYFDRKVEIVRQVTQAEPEVSSREVAGHEAMVSRFSRQEAGQPALDKTEVIFIAEGRGWSIALVVPYSERTAYDDVFDAFLESFRFLPPDDSSTPDD